MSASRVRRTGRRLYLGSPIVPINPPPTYLRHRAAAARADRARRRAMLLRRLLLALACPLLYVAIGRDLVALAVAKKDTAVMEFRVDTQRLTKDLERIVDTSQVRNASESVSPIAFTSAAALIGEEDPDDVDAWLSDEPVHFSSRAD